MGVGQGNSCYLCLEIGLRSVSVLPDAMCVAAADGIADTGTGRNDTSSSGSGVDIATLIEGEVYPQKETWPEKLWPPAGKKGRRGVQNGREGGFTLIYSEQQRRCEGTLDDVNPCTYMD